MRRAFPYQLAPIALAVALTMSMVGSAAIAATPAPAPAAAAPAEAATKAGDSLTLPIVPVVVSDHQGGKRLAFNWKQNVKLDIVEKNGEWSLKFGRPGAIDLRKLLADAAALKPRVEGGLDELVVVLTPPPGTRVTQSRNGNQIFVDAAPGKPGDKPPEKAPEKAASDKAGSEKTGHDKAEAAPEKAAEKPGDKPGEKTAAQIGERAAAFVEAAGKQGVVVGVVVSEEGAKLRFDFGRPTAGAVFRRGGALWIVFDAGSTVDLTPVRGASTIITEAEQVPHKSATVLRLVTADGLYPRVQRNGTMWSVDLAPRVALADAPIGVDVMAAARPPRVVFAAPRGAPAIVVADVELGDSLTVVPLPELGQGVQREYSFVDFRALPTVQGLAFVPISDGFQLKVTDAAVEVGTSAGLAVSPGIDRVLRQAADSQSRLFDFSSWRGPAEQPAADRRRVLERRVVTAPALGRSAARLDLARFYFATGFAPEALGVLDAIERDDPDFASAPANRALRGAVSYLAGDRDGALRDFGLPALDGEPEALLWRGMLAADTGDAPAAVRNFQAGQHLLGNYPKGLRNRIALRAIESLQGAGGRDRAAPLLQSILTENPNPADLAMARFLEGRQRKVAGDTPGALAIWDDVVAETKDRRAIARAGLARTMARLETSEMTRGEAIDALDKLRFTWRGDETELGVLKNLAELRLADGDFRGGLGALRQVMTLFPESPELPPVMKAATTQFANLFLGKDAANASPVKSVALYDEFRDFLPTDARLDEIMTRLADRLVAVDLLERAGSVLEDQAKRRPAGLDRARVTTRLAVVRLMDRKPEAAIAALDKDVGSETPPDLTAQRVMLRARALVELGRGREALAAIANDTSREADRLRADIAWRASDWPAAAGLFGRLASPPGPDGRVDEETAKLVLSWAAALTLANDRPALGQMIQRYGAAMDASPMKDAFRTIAGQSQGGKTTNLAALAGRLAQVSDLQSFLAGYRQQAAAGKLSSIN